MIRLFILIAFIIILSYQRYKSKKKWGSTLFNSGNWIEYHKPKTFLSSYNIARVLFIGYLLYLIISLLW